MNYTKGEWRVYCYKHTKYQPLIVYAGNNNPETNIIAHCGYSKANAHLISAAPDMYEALVAIRTYFSDEGLSNRLTNEQRVLIIKALAKAEGK